MESLKQLKKVLLEHDMTVSDLARELRCSRASIYLVFSGGCPDIKEKIEAFFKTHKLERV